MLMNKTNGTTTEQKANSMEASMALMNRLKGSVGRVKPVLAEGHYTVKFMGINFVETMKKGNKCMGLQIKYTLNGQEYDETVAIYGESVEAQEAIMGQCERYRDQIAEQFGLIGQEFYFEDLNKYIGKDLDIKVYLKEFANDKGEARHARAFGFWRKPNEAMAEAAVTVTEVPKY